MLSKFKHLLQPRVEICREKGPWIVLDGIYYGIGESEDLFGTILSFSYKQITNLGIVPIASAPFVIPRDYQVPGNA